MALRNIIAVSSFFILALSADVANGWNELGHRAVCIMAFDLLDSEMQQQINELILNHPTYKFDFESKASSSRELFSLVGFWPDRARGTDFDRPKWHYVTDAILIIGAKNECRIPITDLRTPDDAVLDTLSLNLPQAMALCRRKYADPAAPAPERALSLCWLSHLCADSHLPAHAGSLYSSGIFPSGDKGANEIRLADGANLHAVWDQLLGTSKTYNAAVRAAGEMKMDAALVAAGEAASMELDTAVWLSESRELAKSHLYSPEIVEAVSAASRGLTDAMPRVTLEKGYFKEAGKVAKLRAVQAAYRLAGILAEPSGSNAAISPH